MSTPFTARYDRASNRIEFCFTGSWDRETMDSWNRTFNSLVAQARRGFTILADLSAYPPQSPEISAGHEKHMKHALAAGMSRAAMVVPGALSGLQMKRLAGGAGINPVVSYVDSRHDGLRQLAA